MFLYGSAPSSNWLGSYTESVATLLAPLLHYFLCVSVRRQCRVSRARMASGRRSAQYDRRRSARNVRQAACRPGTLSAPATNVLPPAFPTNNKRAVSVSAEQYNCNCNCGTIRYDTRCYFNCARKPTCQLNLPH